MKIRMLLTVIAMSGLLGYSAVAQTNSKIKTGTKITYAASDPGASVSLPVTLTIPATGGIVVDYTVKQPQKSYNGKISISKNGLDNATAISWGDLSPDENRMLSDNETAFCFSRSFYDQIVKTKSATYNGVSYELQNDAKESQLKVGAKTVNVLYVVGKNGTKYWILKDAQYPLLMKVNGNQDGPNLIVTFLSGV